MRRGSEPALNNFGKNVPTTDDEEEIFPWLPAVKRWSSTASPDEHKSPRVCNSSLVNVCVIPNGVHFSCCSSFW